MKQLDQHVYAQISEAIRHFSDNKMPLIHNFFREYPEHRNVLLDILLDVIGEQKEISFRPFQPLLAVVLEDEHLAPQALSVFLKDEFLTIENCLYLLEVIRENIFKTIKQSHDRWPFYRVAHDIIAKFENDDHRYLLVTDANRDHLKYLNRVDSAFEPYKIGEIYTTKFAHREEYFDHLNSLGLGSELRRLWWQACEIKGRFFEIFMGIIFDVHKRLGDADESGTSGFEEAELLKHFYDMYKRKYRVTGNRDFLAKLDMIFWFCFTYFNIDDTGQTNSLFSSHGGIYEILSMHLDLDPEEHLNIALHEYKKVSYRYACRFTTSYRGAELMGGGVSQMGSNFELADSHFVREVLTPFLVRLKGENYANGSHGGFWDFLTERFLKRPDQVSPENPVFLKRASVPILLDMSYDPDDKGNKEAFESLLIIFQIKDGIPHCSEVIFYHLSKKLDAYRESSLFRENTRRLIRKDLEMHGNIPGSVFCVQVICDLVRHNDEEAESLLFDLVQNERYIENDDFHYNTFGQLKDLSQSHPSFALKLVRQFLSKKEWMGSDRRMSVYEVTPHLVAIIQNPHDKKASEGAKELVVEMTGEVKKAEPKERLLNSLFQGLADTDVIEAYSLFKKGLGQKSPQSLFKFSREGFVRIAEKLTESARDVVDEKDQEKRLDMACEVIEMFLDDPDPETNEEENEFNYHLKIKRGEDVMVISTVRGHLCWAIQKICLYKYCFAVAWTYTLKLLKDQNFYIRTQALVPFIEIMKRRKSHPNLISDIENTALDLLNSDIPDKMARYLLHVFAYFRNLNEENALTLISKFRSRRDVSLFYVYFALFREKHFTEKGEFQADRFKKILKHEITTPSGELVIGIFNQFHNLVEEDPDYLFEIFPYLIEYKGNTDFDTDVIRVFLSIIETVLSGDTDPEVKTKAVEALHYAIQIIRQYVTKTYGEGDESIVSPYWMRYGDILTNIYDVSKKEFYDIAQQIIGLLEISKQVYIDYKELVKILVKETETKYCETVLELLKRISSDNVMYMKDYTRYLERVRNN